MWGLCPDVIKCETDPFFGGIQLWSSKLDLVSILPVLCCWNSQNGSKLRNQPTSKKRGAKIDQYDVWLHQTDCTHSLLNQTLSILAICHDVINDAGASVLCNRQPHTHTNTHTHTHMHAIYHSQNKLSNQGPSQLGPVHRNVENFRGNILIRGCFLTGSWEGSIISCYA